RSRHILNLLCRWVGVRVRVSVRVRAPRPSPHPRFARPLPEGEVQPSEVSGVAETSEKLSVREQFPLPLGEGVYEQRARPLTNSLSLWERVRVRAPRPGPHPRFARPLPEGEVQPSEASGGAETSEGWMIRRSVRS